MKKEMKRLLGCIRKADRDFGLITPGDHVMVGVSGGKDSLMLLVALKRYQQFMHQSFDLTAVTAVMGTMETEKIAGLCRQLEIPYEARSCNIREVVFEERQERNPCSLCAKMRRGMLVTMAKEKGCNKIALGHHRDDAVETFLMSLLYEGRMHTFAPLTYLDRNDITQIRPMIYVEEARIRSLAEQLMLPVVQSTCPVNGQTNRQHMKQLVQHLSETVGFDAGKMIFSALENTDAYDLWHKLSDPGQS